MKVRCAPLALAVAAVLSTAAAAKSTAPGVPPIIKVKDIFGKTKRAQIYPISLDRLALKPLTTAQQHYVWRVIPPDRTAPFVVKLRCPVRASGHIWPLDCTNLDDGQFSPEAITAQRMLSESGDLIPALPAISVVDAERVLRFIELEVLLDPHNRPTVDFKAGRLLDKTALPQEIIRAWSEDYPPAALRADAQGRLTVICKIQSDHSVVCTEESFDPPENGRYFQGWIADRMKKVRIPKTLLDGTDPVGARWRAPINFRIPH